MSNMEIGARIISQIARSLVEICIILQHTAKALKFILVNPDLCFLSLKFASILLSVFS